MRAKPSAINAIAISATRRPIGSGGSISMAGADNGRSDYRRVRWLFGPDRLTRFDGFIRCIGHSPLAGGCTGQPYSALPYSAR